MVIEKIKNDDKPLIVLLHGGNSTASEWDKHVEVLKEHFSIWLFHIPGHGKDKDSRYEPIRYNAENLINEIKKEYDYCYVYGRGLGGQIAISMMLEDGNFIKKAVIENPLCIDMGLMKFPFRMAMTSSYNPSLEAIENGLMLSKDKFKLMVRDNTSFVLDKRIYDSKSKLYVLHAEKVDKFIITSADYLCGIIKDSIRKTYPYDQYLGLTHFDEVFPPILDFLLD